MNHDLHAEGVYLARALSWGFVETTNQFDQFFMRFAVIGLMDRNNLDAEPKPCSDGTGTWSITATDEENAAWLISTVQHLGYTGDDLLSLDPSTPGAFDFEGREFLVACKHEEYNDQTRVKWSVYRPSIYKPLPKERIVALNDRFGHLVPELKQRRAAKAKEAEAAAKFPETPARAAPHPKGPDTNNTTKPVPKNLPF